MKKTLLRLLIFTSFQPLFAQDYLNENSQWYTISGDIFDNYYSNSQYKVVGDTLIEGSVYYKIDHQYDWLNLTMFGMDTIEYIPELHSLKFLREEDKKFYEWRFNQDRFIIDFDLEIGDTVFNDFIPQIVENIDTIYIDNSPRKVFLTNWGDKVYEGIGTSKGAFEGLNFGGDEYFSILMCYGHNDEVYELHDGWVPEQMTVQPCEDFLSETAEEFGFSTFKISPNPANAYFQLAISETKGATFLTIFNANGQLIQQKSIQNGTTEVDISNFKKGIYFIGIQNEKGNHFEKLLKL